MKCLTVVNLAKRHGAANRRLSLGGKPSFMAYLRFTRSRRLAGKTAGPTWVAAFALAVVLAATVYAQLNMTADQVFTFIKSSIQLHHDDRKVADYVKKIKLSDKLDERRVEELQGMGAGQLTVAALRTLSSSSASLPT